MKRVGYITDKDGRRITLLEVMGDYGNVQKAYNKARKCKRHRKDVLIFTKDKEENLDKVREDILNLAYEPSEYHYFKVYEPKERQIMALPFYDRVVQHAINNVLEPIFDKRFISQSYACRKGKGMHAASDTLKEWLYEWNKYHPDQPLYAIKADIHHYFQSIDHAVLKTEIRKVIKDAGVLALLDRIIDHNGNMPDGVGIPVGNLTSQLFANIYLDALDQFIKHELGVEAYIRYMDDFVILSPDKEQLRSWLARIEQFLREELKLEFNPKTTILAAKNGIDFVGYKHRATHRKVRKDSIKRIKRTEFIEAAAHNKIIQLVVLAIVCDTVFGVLRAIKEKKFNSCAGIDGAIRKVGMLISLVFMLAIDVLIKINLIGFIPEQARTYLGLDTVGVAEFFALLYIAYEVVSIFKNMALCGLPVKKVWEKVREFLAKYTDELPDTDELDGDSTTGNVEEHRTQER